MKKFNDSLRDYAFPIHQRDGFVCVYCGLDGKIWPNWLYLSWDHLVPTEDSRRKKSEYIVTACIFCNEVHNRTKLLEVEGKTPIELVAQKKPLVQQRRKEYKDFWKERVKLIGRGKARL